MRRAQQHITLVLDEYLTTFEQDKHESQAVTYFSFLLYSAIQNTVDTHCLDTN